MTDDELIEHVDAQTIGEEDVSNALLLAENELALHFASACAQWVGDAAVRLQRNPPEPNAARRRIVAALRTWPPLRHAEVVGRAWRELTPGTWSGWTHWAGVAGGAYGLKPRETALLGQLALYVNDDDHGRCFPTRETLMASLGWSKDTLDKAKNTLTQRGLITFDPAGKPRRGTRPSGLYQLVDQLPDLGLVPARAGASPAEDSPARAVEDSPARAVEDSPARAVEDPPARAGREHREGPRASSSRETPALPPAVPPHRETLSPDGDMRATEVRDALALLADAGIEAAAVEAELQRLVGAHPPGHVLRATEVAIAQQRPQHVEFYADLIKPLDDRVLPEAAR